MIVGAGLSGICALERLLRMGMAVRVYEAGHDVGEYGTSIATLELASTPNPTPTGFRSPRRYFGSGGGGSFSQHSPTFLPPVELPTAASDIHLFNQKLREWEDY